MRRLALATAGLIAASTLAPLALTASAPAAVAAPASSVTVRNGCFDSVPDPGSTDPVRICWTMFKPSGADSSHRVPMIVHSHGWGGERTRTPSSFRRWLDHGYGVISFDQRGFGDSGGHAYVENPAVEGQDVRRLIALVARQSWVRKDGPGDPRMGAIGGSYGGGYQYLAAFTSIQRTGKPILDALAPEITWFDLNQSLAPQGVVRTEWAYALSAASLESDALPPKVYAALAEGSATGQWPDGSTPGTTDMRAFFRRNGPKWHTDHGRRLRIPVLMGQGTTDTLFPLEQALQTWRSALAPVAKRHSIFIAYNGGHVLPSVLPRGVEVSSDPCSQKLARGSFARAARLFMDEKLKGRSTVLRGYGRFHFATPSSTCTSVGSYGADAAYPIGTVATTEAAGAPIPYEVAQGPVRLAGQPFLTADVTALGIDNRAFYGLGVGTSPADAHLVQNNVLPIRLEQPVTGKRMRIKIPAVAVNVPKGQNLYLIATPFSDTFAGMGSRTPGAITLDNTVVHVPRVG